MIFLIDWAKCKMKNTFYLKEKSPYFASERGGKKMLNVMGWKIREVRVVLLLQSCATHDY